MSLGYQFAYEIILLKNEKLPVIIQDQHPAFSFDMIFNFVKGQDFTEGLQFALVIALSINVALIVSTVSGTVIPLIINHP